MPNFVIHLKSFAAMVQSTSIDQADVVFLVEGTAINGAYLNDMKANYIVPTLEYFSQTEEDMGCVLLTVWVDRGASLNSRFLGT